MNQTVSFFFSPEGADAEPESDGEDEDECCGDPPFVAPPPQAANEQINKAPTKNLAHFFRADKFPAPFAVCVCIVPRAGYVKEARMIRKNTILLRYSPDCD
mgnify:CR=1 FL=1